jgi:hypothetical protein
MYRYGIEILKIIKLSWFLLQQSREKPVDIEAELLLHLYKLNSKIISSAKKKQNK